MFIILKKRNIYYSDKTFKHNMTNIIYNFFKKKQVCLYKKTVFCYVLFVNACVEISDAIKDKKKLMRNVNCKKFNFKMLR